MSTHSMFQVRVSPTPDSEQFKIEIGSQYSSISNPGGPGVVEVGFWITFQCSYPEMKDDRQGLGIRSRSCGTQGLVLIISVPGAV